MPMIRKKASLAPSKPLMWIFEPLATPGGILASIRFSFSNLKVRVVPEKASCNVISVSYTHLTLPTNREV